MALLYKLHSKQKLPISLDKAWDFLTDPANLQKITPPDMGFEILYGNERKTYAGQLIEYRVSPFKGYTTSWVTEITHVRDRELFVDEQRFGPYKLWHHKHFVREIDGGVEMEDLVHYKLPMGFLGRLVHPWLVKPKLEEIFRFRESALNNLFGKYEPSPTDPTLKQDILN